MIYLVAAHITRAITMITRTPTATRAPLGKPFLALVGAACGTGIAAGAGVSWLIGCDAIGSVLTCGTVGSGAGVSGAVLTSGVSGGVEAIGSGAGAVGGIIGSGTLGFVGC